MPKELGVQFPISVGNRGKYEHRMKRLRRQLPFLQSVLKEANRFKRQELLQHANADQVNAVSELVLNLLKQNIPITPITMNQLRPHKNVLRNLARRKHSLKKTTAVARGSKRSWPLARSPHRIVSMSSTVKLSTWASLLQDANRARDHCKEECQYWQHKYETLYQTHMHTLKNLLCDACRASPDRQELCDGCSARWKKFT